MPDEEKQRSQDFKVILQTLPHQPGVYRMLNNKGKVIYIGKAFDLKKRVSSYFNKTQKDSKTQALVAQIADINITITHSENEALILENNLIKALRPRYNVIFKDDKSYPYLVFTQGEFPQLKSYRGLQKKQYRYFGPYPNQHTARESLQLLQKLFKLRNCEDSMFKNRKRPCLQHQIGRCSAPCVKKISEEDYQKNVKLAELFLKGKNDKILTEFKAQMELAAQNLAFEQAAALRDKITILRRAQEQQSVYQQKGDIDIVVILQQEEQTVVELMMVRCGKNIDNKAYFPQVTLETTRAQIINSFIAQHYLPSATQSALYPKEIIVNAMNDETKKLVKLISAEVGRHISCIQHVRSEKRRWLELALKNGAYELEQYVKCHATLGQRFSSLHQLLSTNTQIERLACFDISHHQGESTVASCVVFNHHGPLKNEYRRLNITDITPGDDYAAMAQALKRYYQSIQEHPEKQPDLLVIDGGKGQLKQAKEILAEFKLKNTLILGIAKGPSRKAGLEEVFLVCQDNYQPLNTEQHPLALFLLQHIRDEAHRFAITAHRKRQSKKKISSALEQIDGIGPKKRLQLLQHFGGIREIKAASVEEIAKTPGISLNLAKRILKTFRNTES